MSRPPYVRFVLFYVLLELLCAAPILALEERFSASELLQHHARISAWQLGLYVLGVYVLRFPFGTLLSLLFASSSGLLGLLSVVPNALLAAWLFARLGRGPHVEKSSGSKSGNSTLTG